MQVQRSANMRACGAGSAVGARCIPERRLACQSEQVVCLGMAAVCRHNRHFMSDQSVYNGLDVCCYMAANAYNDDAPVFNIVTPLKPLALLLLNEQDSMILLNDAMPWPS